MRRMGGRGLRRLGTGLLLLIAPVVAGILIYWLSPPSSGPEPEQPSALALNVSTSSAPLPPPQETVLDVSTELSPLPVRLCAGGAVRFRNRHAGPVILSASDFSFSSGIIPPGGEFSAVFPAPGKMKVLAQSPGGSRVMEPYPVEVRPCTGPAEAREPTPTPTLTPTATPAYTLYLPLVLRVQGTVTLTIPVSQVVALLSYGHTFPEAFDPSGGHVCTTCERWETPRAGEAYEAGYGTWYYINRSFVSIPIPEGITVISAVLDLDVFPSSYQYSGPSPTLYLNLGTWTGPLPDNPDNWRLLWGAWDPNAVLGAYPFPPVEGPQAAVIPLDVRYIHPGETLKFVWRLREDDRNIVNPDGNATVSRVGIAAVDWWRPVRLVLYLKGAQ